MLELFPQRQPVTRWIEKARERVKFQGLPARICWLEYGERAEAGAAFQLAGEDAAAWTRRS